MTMDSLGDFNQFVPRRTLDQDLIDFSYNEKMNEKQKNEKSFFDNSLNTQALVNAIGSPMPLAQNRRGVTWNIPRLELIHRSNPYVIRAVNWISSKSLIKGIDINSQDDKITSKELGETQENLMKLYRSLKKNGRTWISLWW